MIPPVWQPEGRVEEEEGGGGGGRWVICRLGPHKSLLYDEHSAYDLWSTEAAS